MIKNLKLFTTVIVLICFGVFFSCTKSSDNPIQTVQNQENTDTTTLVWVDYHWGELPPVGHYDALDSIVTRWNLNYQRVQGGCEASEVSKERRKFEKNNPVYFDYLEEKFGKDWREKFNKEVEELEVILQKDTTIIVKKNYND